MSNVLVETYQYKVFRRNRFCFYVSTTITYRASTGPEQSFPRVVFPHREKPFFNTGFPGDENRFFLLETLHRESPVFITGMGLQWQKFGGDQVPCFYFTVRGPCLFSDLIQRKPCEEVV